MNSFYAMQRANGDWFAVDDNGCLRMLIFKSSGEAMMARSRDSGMECFKPVAFDTRAFKEFKMTEGDRASFLVVADSSRNVKRGLRLNFTELAPLLTDFAEGKAK